MSFIGGVIKNVRTSVESGVSFAVVLILED